MGLTRLKRYYGAQKPPRAARIDFAHPLARGLIGAWVMNEQTGLTVFDYARGMKNGTLDSSSVGSLPEWKRGGLEFETSEGEYVDLDYADVYGPDGGEAGQLTILARCKPISTSPSDARIVAKQSSSSTSAHIWMLGLYGGGYNLRIRLKAGGSVVTLYTTGNHWELNETFDVALRYDGENAEIWKNGVYLIGAAKSGTVAQDDTVTSRIGTGNDGSGGTYSSFPGDIYFVYIWNRALAKDELRRLRREPFAFFYFLKQQTIGEILKQISDSGQGADAIGAVSVSLGISDAGQGSDDIAPGASLAVPDSGQGSDAIAQLLADLIVQDAGQGSDILAQLLANLTIGDTGSGTDALAQLLAELSIQDAGQGSDAIAQILAALKVTDLGTGADAVDILKEVLKIIQDSGYGADTVAQILAGLKVADAGQGSDAPAIGVTFKVTDVGAGADTIDVLKEILKTVSDSGTGTDTISSISVGLSVPDAGAGADQIGISVSLAISDAATGADLVAIAERLVKIADVASAIDGISAVSVKVPVIDTGHGTDAVGSLSAILSVLDAVTGVDTVIAYDATKKIVAIVFTFASRRMAFGLKARTIPFAMKTREILMAWAGTGGRSTSG